MTTPRDGAAEDPPEAGGLPMTRRNAARFLLAFAGTAAVSVLALDGLRSLAGLAQVGDHVDRGLFVRGTPLVTRQGTPLTADALEAGSGRSLTAYPQARGGGPVLARDATLVLLRFDPASYPDPAGTAEGYVAFSQVCTDAGCLVTDRSGRNLLCPCHGSVFDPLRGARVLEGPAPRPLPQLPLAVTRDGRLLVADGPLSGPVGPA